MFGTRVEISFMKNTVDLIGMCLGFSESSRKPVRLFSTLCQSKFWMEIKFT